MKVEVDSLIMDHLSNYMRIAQPWVMDRRVSVHQTTRSKRLNRRRRLHTTGPKYSPITMFKSMNKTSASSMRRQNYLKRRYLRPRQRSWLILVPCQSLVETTQAIAQSTQSRISVRVKR